MWNLKGGVAGCNLGHTKVMELDLHVLRTVQVESNYLDIVRSKSNHDYGTSITSRWQNPNPITSRSCDSNRS